ncbi:MAG: hypothetical protein ACR2QT_02700 [Woeseiaceae bacterium]
MPLAEHKAILNDAASHALAVALCLAAPLLVFLNANDYSVVALEIWPLYLLALFFGLIVAAFVLLRKTLLTRLGLWAGVTVAIALMTTNISVATMLVVAIVVAGLLKLLREHAAKIILFAASVHIATTIVLSQLEMTTTEISNDTTEQSHESGDSNLPPVVHIILDEMIGPHGLPAEMAQSRDVESEIAAVFNAQSFDVYRRAYTQYLSTFDSLSNLFNFDSSPVQEKYFSRPQVPPALSENRYFQYLNNLGYAIHVFESNHLNFCDTPNIAVSTCYRYRSNSIAAIRDHEFATLRKSMFVLDSFLESSRFWRGLRRAYNAGAQSTGLNLPVWAIGDSRTGPLTSIPVMDLLQSRLRDLRRGQVYFAHLMLPHYPYALDADCSIDDQLGEWEYRAPRSVLGTLLQQNDTQSRKSRYAQYLPQYQCSLQSIADMIDAIKSSGQWRESIIIVQGDHGSRIVRNFPGANSGTDAEDDFRDVHSTFFAFKNANSDGANNNEATSLQSALSQVWNLDQYKDSQHWVYLAELGTADLVAVELQGFD